ncbi:hypothetical protein LTR86_001295 [Recurvomyces mirabilis]|nr:hypothetical protein LTR86_001295 [Recurvomyces mirabilis]
MSLIPARRTMETIGIVKLTPESDSNCMPSRDNPVHSFGQHQHFDIANMEAPATRESTAMVVANGWSPDSSTASTLADSSISDTRSTAVARVFSIVELLVVILANVELQELHLLQRVNSTFRQTIRTSPILERVAGGFTYARAQGRPFRDDIVLRKTFTICDKGSIIRISYVSAVSDRGMVAHAVVTLPLSGHGQRVHGLWERIKLHQTNRFRYGSNAPERSPGYMKVKLGSEATLADLVTAVVQRVKDDEGLVGEAPDTCAI